MIMKIPVIAITICLLLMGCESKGQQEELKGVIPASQLEALEKAKGVEQALLDAEKNRRKSME